MEISLAIRNSYEGILTYHVMSLLVAADKDLNFGLDRIHEDRHKEGQLVVPVIALSKVCLSQLQEDIVSCRTFEQNLQILALDAQ